MKRSFGRSHAPYAPDGTEMTIEPAARTRDWQHPMPLRFRDLDYLGHVTAAQYLAMFEEARAAWLSVRFDTPYPTYVVARQEIDFDRELRMHDGPVTVTIELVRIGARSLDISERLESRDATLHARSRATLVLWNARTRRSRDLTEPERTTLEHGRADGRRP